MVRNSKYERLLRNYEDALDKINDVERLNKKLYGEIISVTAALQETTEQLKQGVETHTSALNMLKRLDKERLKVVSDKKALIAENEQLRKMISDLSVENKLDNICSTCKWCDKDGGVTCVCPEDCFYAMEGE